MVMLLLAGVARAAEPAQPFAVKKTATGGATVLLEGKPVAEYIVPAVDLRRGCSRWPVVCRCRIHDRGQRQTRQQAGCMGRHVII